MAGSAHYDMLAVGSLDKVLTHNPTTTFWRSTWKRHTRFSIESLSQPFNTATAFGQESQILLNRVGDMVYFLYLHVELPGIVACDTNTEACPGVASGGQFPVYMDGGGACNPCAKMDEAALLEYLPSNYNELSNDQQMDALKEAKDIWRREKYGAGRELDCCAPGNDDCPDELLGDTWAHWCNDVGHFLVSKCKLIIGGQMIDQLWSTFLFCWEELTGKSGRRLTELTGRRYTRSQLVCDSREQRHLYIPLPFYFTLNSGSALPLVSLSFHGVSLHCEMERLERLIVVSGSHVAVRNAKTGLGLGANDLKAELEVTYVYLDQQEREKFTSATFEQLIIQTQHYFQTESKAICRIPLSFNHPVLEMIFCCRRQCQERCNNWGNLSGIDGRDPIESAELLLNTSSRFGKKPAIYWRAVVPYQVHSNIPEAFIYVMSFALQPEASLEPSGSCNMSRIDNVEMCLTMQPGLANESVNVMIWARSWNLMRFREGVGGPAFS